MNSAGESMISSSAAPPVPIPLIVQVFDHPINRKPIFHMANSDRQAPRTSPHEMVRCAFRLDASELSTSTSTSSPSGSTAATAQPRHALVPAPRARRHDPTTPTQEGADGTTPAEPATTRTSPVLALLPPVHVWGFRRAGS